MNALHPDRERSSLRPALLDVQSLEVSYGAIRALHRVSFALREGEWLSVLGANGAGKSTLLKAISGIVTPRNGVIEYASQPLGTLPIEARARLGIRLVPEGRGVLQTLSVEENLGLGLWARPKAEFRSILEQAFDLFPRLKERRAQEARTLSGGEQQMLAIARAWSARPKLLLLDEPSLGLAPQWTARIFEALARLQQAGASILLVEQNARLALRHSERALVLKDGNVIREGSAQALAADPDLARAYLGS